MLAVRLHAAGAQPVLERVPLPEPSGTQVRIRVAGCGVCHTDVHIVRGEQIRVRLPLTLGHEVAGWVDAIGPEAEAPLRAAGLAGGSAVIVSGGWGCAQCEDCRRGEEQRCLDGSAPGFQDDGGYAEAMLVPHPRHLVGLGGLDPVHAAPLADAGVTPYRAVRRAGPWLGSGGRVLVIGFGGLGQFALQYLRRIEGLRVVVSETAPARAELASGLGADAVTGSGDATTIRDALEGPADVVFDFVGTDETLRLGSAVVAPGGLLMLVGEAGGQLGFGFALPAIEQWLTTTAWGSRDELAEVVALGTAGAITWTTETLPLDQASVALARVADAAVPGRLVLVPPGTT